MSFRACREISCGDSPRRIAPASLVTSPIVAVTGTIVVVPLSIVAVTSFNFAVTEAIVFFNEVGNA